MTALSLDVGDRRIGVAVSDPTELIARPLSVITRKSNLQAAEAIARITRETGARVVVVGLPIGGDEEPGQQARKTLAFVRFLRERLPIEIVTWDERLSTREAQEELISQGVRRSRRREMLDAAAAAVILDDWLTSAARDRRASREHPGAEPEGPRFGTPEPGGGLRSRDDDGR